MSTNFFVISGFAGTAFTNSPYLLITYGFYSTFWRVGYATTAVGGLIERFLIGVSAFFIGSIGFGGVIFGGGVGYLGSGVICFSTFVYGICTTGVSTFTSVF